MPGLDMIFPEQLESLEKPLQNVLGKNLVFTSDITILNILLFVGFLFILDRREGMKSEILFHPLPLDDRVSQGKNPYFDRSEKELFTPLKS